MTYGIFGIIFVFALKAIPLAAFEARNPAHDQRDLHIELETVPSPVQESFDRYVQDLAAAAQREARHEEHARAEQLAKAQPSEVVNPIVLFRW